MQFFIFGRVATWVSAVPAVPGIQPVAVETLMQRLLSINDQDVPYTISRGTHTNEIIVDWRYADATWLDLMRAHGMRKRSEEHTSELQSLMRISYAVFCLKKKKNKTITLTKADNERKRKHQ